MTLAEITERLGKLQELSDNDLHELRLAVVTGMATLEGDTEAAQAAHLSAMRGVSEIITDAVVARANAAVTASAAPDVASARRGKIASMARRQGRAKPSPELGDQSSRTALVATGAMRGVTPNTALDKDSLAAGMAATLDGLRGQVPAGPRGSHGKDVVIIASANWRDQYPEERRMTGNEAVDTHKWRAITDPDALVATGGICSPVNVDWSIGMIASSDRPVQENLPATEASRGGLIYRPDLDFAALEAGIGIWTEATDLSPAGATKPIYTVACPSTETVYVEAVTCRIGFGNMQSRFDPETVAANTNASLAAAARVADNNLLNLIAGQCTQGVTSGKVLGATRDLLMCLGQCIAAYRNLHRIPRTQKIRACFPDWVKELIRIDILRQTAVAASDTLNPFAVTDEQIEDFFTVWGVSPIFHLDGQSTSAPGLSGAVNQYFTAQGANGAIEVFPTEMVWYLWYEGAFQYLDGGRLDLGIVRDSLLDATNDYESFCEQFETVAYRGFTGGAIQLISTLCANGASAATVTTTSSCA